MELQIILITLIAFIGYSEDFLGTTLISRPIVLGPLVGLILGHFTAGIVTGATLELVFIGVMSIGAAIPPDVISAGVLGTAFSIMAGQGPAVALALAVPISMLAQLIITGINIVRAVFLRFFDAAAEKGDYKKIQWLHFLTFLIRPVLMGLIVFFSLQFGSDAMKNILSAIPDWVNNGLNAVGNLLPALGVALLMSLMLKRNVIVYYFLGFVLAAYLKLPIIAVGILAAISAVIIIGLSRKNNGQVEIEESEADQKSSQPTGLISNSVLRKVFFRSMGLEANWNFERMQSTGFCFSMIPVLKKLYPKKEDMAPALKRHLAFFNTTPYSSTFILGLSSAMEEQNSVTPDFDTDSINTVKAGLMGPMSGVFDSVFWGTFKVIASGVGASLAINGNILGPILFLLVYNIPHFLVRYPATFIGYKTGTRFLEKIAKGDLMGLVTLGASIIGLMVVGGMTASLIPFATTVSFGMTGATVTLQSILDSILPNMLPLGLAFLMYFLYKKGAKSTWLLLGLIVIGFVLSLVHFM